MTNLVHRSSFVCLGLVTALLLTALPARATTVIPPSFDELVTEADTVFTGDVLGVSSQYTGEGATRRIVSDVTFTVLRVMKGQAATPFTLHMLGGTVGTRTLEVDGAPKFAVGNRVIVFVKDNGKQFFPAVGIMHGVYRIESDAAVEVVHDEAGRALDSVDDIGKEPAEGQTRRLAATGKGTAPTTGMTRAQFEDAIAGRVHSLGLE